MFKLSKLKEPTEIIFNVRKISIFLFSLATPPQTKNCAVAGNSRDNACANNLSEKNFYFLFSLETPPQTLNCAVAGNSRENACTNNLSNFKNANLKNLGNFKNPNLKKIPISKNLLYL